MKRMRSDRSSDMTVAKVNYPNLLGTIINENLSDEMIAPDYPTGHKEAQSCPGKQSYGPGGRIVG